MRKIGMRRRAGDGLVDHGERFVRRRRAFGRVEQRQRRAQQRAQHRRLGRLARHQAQQRFAAAQLAHRAVGDVLDRAARLRRDVIGAEHDRQRLRQRHAALHAGDGAGRAQQRQGQRVGFEVGLVVALRRDFDFMTGAQARLFTLRTRNVVLQLIAGRRCRLGRCAFALRLTTLPLSLCAWLPALGGRGRLAACRAGAAPVGRRLGLGFQGERWTLVSHGE